VLVVDDEPDITALVVYHLAKEGYRVSTAENGTLAIQAVTAGNPDLIILDLMLPGKSGYEVLDHIRTRPETAETGVILLTARRDEEDRIKGLEMGADDYVVKPFSPEELLLRVKAVLRRLGTPGIAAADNLEFGPLTIDRVGHTVTVSAQEIRLTATEYKLLLVLAERAGRVQSRGQLLQAVWQANPDIQTRTVDMHIKRMRSKLGPDCETLIETVRGFGYRLRPPR
jgi:two-component system phosphate regulon response regulator PhoB